MLLLKYETQVGLQNEVRFIDAVKAFVEPIRVEEGCLDYQIFERVEDSQGRVLVLSQIWSSEDLLKLHLAGSRFKRFLEALELLCQPPRVHIYRVSEIMNALSIEAFLNDFSVGDHEPAKTD